MNLLRAALVSSLLALGCNVDPGPVQQNIDGTKPVTVVPEMTAPVVDDLPALPDRAPELFATSYRRATGIESVDFDDLVARPADYTGRTIETRGVVRASCQIRGCWMEVRSVRDVKSSSMTVRFKNYSFFVPLDSRSADVRFQGVVKVETITAAQVAEYESEGYVFGAKNADGSVTQVGFTADGVEMWRER
ncbi:MAG: DUF4920 domain-containing protein [Archangium sp.]|nr:DUF4920 domain-containing protein [Archangium sp.]